MSELIENVTRAVVTVGPGRGFIVETGRGRYVITAAHCLPYLPPRSSISFAEERTYESLLGPLGKQPAVWAECRFADPVGDIAVLGSPDGQVLFDEAAAYDELVDSGGALAVESAPTQGRAYILALDGHWFGCAARHRGGPIWLFETDEAIAGGMSGSPIVLEHGVAIGVMVTSTESESRPKFEGGPQPNLMANLPGWLLREFE